MTLFNIILYSLLCVTSAEAWTRCPLGCKCQPDTSNTTTWQVHCEGIHAGKTPMKLPRNTTALSIEKSGVYVLYKDVFQYSTVGTLKMLSLTENNISLIQGEAFMELNRLRELNLSDNHLRSLANGTFLGISNLKELNLDYNEFERTPTENICLLKELRTLRMQGNKLETVYFHECFRQLKHLDEVDVSGNPVREILPRDFEALRDSKITTIHLRRLGLENLIADNFKYLKNLKFLDLTGNKLKSLPDDVFQHTTSLTSLMIGGNKLNQVPNEAVSKLHNLRNLDMSNNDLRNLTFGPEFQNLKHLSQLNLRNNPIGIITNDAFLNLNASGLTHLFLDKCEVKTIADEALLPMKSLRVLGLSYNGLSSSMLKQAFHGLRFAHNLTDLNLDGTNLTNFDNETFRYLKNTSLTNLSAKETTISNLGTGAFQYLRKLQYLNLRNSSTGVIRSHAFMNLDTLIELDLSENFMLLDVPLATDVNLEAVKVLKLTGSVSETEFFSGLKGYKMLEEIHLDRNNIRGLPDDMFLDTPYLKILILSHNLMSTITMQTFSGLSRLEELHLDHNRLSFVDEFSFAEIRNTLYLDLSHSPRFGSATEDYIGTVFRPMGNLRLLKLTETGLGYLPPDTFQNLSDLSILSLSDNSLSNLDSRSFQSQNNLTILSLARNNLTTVPKRLLQSLTELRELDISNNPFNCSCHFLSDLQWFTYWIRRGFVYMNNLDSVRCSSSQIQKGQNLVDLNMEIDCMTFDVYVIQWTFLTFYVLLVTIATVTYRTRSNIADCCSATASFLSGLAAPCLYLR